MAIDTTTPDYFGLEFFNFADVGYLKNGSAKLGEFDRNAGIGYCAEVLIKTSVAAIPAGSTVDSVTIDFDIDSNSLGGTGVLINVREQNQSSWTDTGTEPTFDYFNINTPWPAGVATRSVNSASTGTITISTTAGLVTLFQNFVDGIKTDIDGILLTLNTGATVWFLNISNIQVNVTYTPPIKRRIFIIT